MFPITNLIKTFKHIARVRKPWWHVGLCVSWLLLVWYCWGRWSPTATVPQYLRGHLRFPLGYTLPETKLNPSDIEKLIFKVERLNANAEVLNWDRYGPVTGATTMLVVQVHKNIERLQHLIISLGQVHFIQQVLVVFSHSYYDEQINSLVKSIQFSRVLQIFYPFSMQLHPDKFPGADPVERGEACTGAPCRRRDALRAQRKHHWWWQAHYVFDGLEMSSSRTLVVFLSEDDYVLPDMLYMLRYMRRSLGYFPATEVMSLGRPPADSQDYSLLLVDTWNPAYERGLSFNLTTWRKIKANASLFCMFDDWRWSQSLQHVFEEGFPGGAASMVASVAARVVDGGGSGGAPLVRSLTQRGLLFPAPVRAAARAPSLARACPPQARAQGGWGDLRDQMLCLEQPVPSETSEATTVSRPYSIDGDVRHTEK